MALVMMGLLFLLMERIFHQREHPMLNMRNLRLLMQARLDGNRELFHQWLYQMDRRQQQRKKDIDRQRRPKRLSDNVKLGIP